MHEVVHAAVAGQQVGRHPRVHHLHVGLQEGLQRGGRRLSYMLDHDACCVQHACLHT